MRECISGGNQGHAELSMPTIIPWMGWNVLCNNMGGTAQLSLGSAIIRELKQGKKFRGLGRWVWQKYQGKKIDFWESLLHIGQRNRAGIILSTFNTRHITQRRRYSVCRQAMSMTFLRRNCIYSGIKITHLFIMRLETDTTGKEGKKLSSWLIIQLSKRATIRTARNDLIRMWLTIQEVRLQLSLCYQHYEHIYRAGKGIIYSKSRSYYLESL